MPKSEIVYLRITQQQRRDMDRIVDITRLGSLSDHLRKAVIEYIERHTEAPHQPHTGPTETK